MQTQYSRLEVLFREGQQKSQRLFRERQEAPPRSSGSHIWPRIDLTLSQMGFREELTLPLPPRLYPELKGKTVLMIDDDLTTLSCFVPELTAATDGKALFLHVVKQSLNELKEFVTSLHPEPEVVLIDSHLAHGAYCGADLAASLRPLLKKSKMFGFSILEESSESFEAARADGFIVKRPAEPWLSIDDLARLVTVQPLP